MKQLTKCYENACIDIKIIISPEVLHWVVYSVTTMGVFGTMTIRSRSGIAITHNVSENCMTIREF